MIEAFSLQKIIDNVDAELSSEIVEIEKEPIEISESFGLMTSFDMRMSPCCRYKAINMNKTSNTKLIGILFAHPNAPLAKTEIINHLNHFHFRSGDAVDFFCVGYGAYWPKGYNPDSTKVTTIDGTDWLFSDKAFSNVIDEIESSTSWEYSGETELLLLSAVRNNKGETNLDFGSAIVCNLEAMNKDKAFSSVRAFFEGVFRFAKKNSDSNPAWALSDSVGLEIGKSALKDAVLSLIPQTLKDSYVQAEHYAIKSLSKT